MAQVIATIAYGIQGLRRGETIWDWPNFNANPEQENLEQMRRWSLNTIPSWSDPPWQSPTNIMTTKPTSQRAHDIDSFYYERQTWNWLKEDRLKDLQAQARVGHKWIPAQRLPYAELILYAYAADRTNRPAYVCLPSGFYNARTGRVLAQAGPEQEITPLPGIYFFDGWRVHPTLVKARDILAAAAKNQTEDGPSTRRAAIRACKYLKAMVNQHGTLIQLAHEAAKVHTQRSKGSTATATQYRPKQKKLPVIEPELTSELLHCLSTLPDPWPLAKITIDMEKPSQWVS